MHDKLISMIKKLLFCSIFLIAFAKNVYSQKSTQQIYALRTYSLTTGNQVNITDDFLKTAFLPALQKMNIGPVGVFKPVKQDDSLKKIMVLIPFKDLEAYASLKERLSADQEFQRNGKTYLGASADDAPYARFSTVLLKAFPDMPQMQPSQVKGERSQRIYELRSYQSPTEAFFANKKEMFNAGGEIKLFEKLGFNAIFYSEVIAGPDMPNLMYMVTFKNEEERDAHWKAFGDNPVWKKLSAMPKYQDNVSHIDNIYLYPTEYSDY